MIDFEPEDRMGRRVLFTPGPLTTTRTVRATLQDDIGSWDADCIELVAKIRYFVCGHYFPPLKLPETGKGRE